MADELQKTKRITGASQMQNNLEARRCRVSVLNKPGLARNRKAHLTVQMGLELFCIF